MPATTVERRDVGQRKCIQDYRCLLKHMNRCCGVYSSDVHLDCRFTTILISLHVRMVYHKHICCISHCGQKNTGSRMHLLPMVSVMTIELGIRIHSVTLRVDDITPLVIEQDIHGYDCFVSFSDHATYLRFITGIINQIQPQAYYPLERMARGAEHHFKYFVDCKLTASSPNRNNIWLKQNHFKTCLHLYAITCLSSIPGNTWEQISKM